MDSFLVKKERERERERESQKKQFAKLLDSLPVSGLRGEQATNTTAYYDKG